MSKQPGQDETDDARARLTQTLLRVGQQDRGAMQNLYALTSAKLLGICQRICGDRDSAEDVLQDVYVKIWRNAARFDPARASPITWLATIARNSAIDWRRTNGRVDQLAPEAAEAVVDEAAAADDMIITDQSRGRIFDCLAALDGRTAGSIRAAFFDGLSYADLAERAKVPLGTMKSVIRRGLLRLKECIGDG